MKLYKTKEKEVYYYFLKNGDKRFIYRHNYYDVTGKRREKSKQGFTSLKLATRALLEVKAYLMDNNHIQAEHDNLTIGQWFNIWYETYNHNWSISTRNLRKFFIDNQLKLIAHYKLKDFTKTMLINQFIKPLIDEYAVSTVKGYYNTFKIGINAAVDEDILDKNRFNKISIGEEEKLTNFLTPQELLLLLDNVRKHENIMSYTAMLLLAYTGLRKGESLALCWKDIDFKAKTLTVSKTRDQYGKRIPKTNNSNRTILIDDVLINQLKKYKAWCIETKFLYGKKLKDTDYILINEESHPIANNTINKALGRTKKRLKEGKKAINDITVHGLRHTHCTILINNGVPINTIADRLGNTPKMILEVYSHSFEELEKKAVSVFSQSLNVAGVSAGEK